MANPEFHRVDPKNYGDNLQADYGPKWLRKRVYFTDFAKAATTADLDTQAGQTVWTQFPAGDMVLGAFISLVTNFAGGGSATATLSIGTVASPAAYVAATSVFSGAPKIVVGLTQVPGTFVTGSGSYPFVGNGTIRVELITDTNTNVLTTGKADIYLLMANTSIRTT